MYRGTVYLLLYLRLYYIGTSPSSTTVLECVLQVVHYSKFGGGLTHSGSEVSTNAAVALSLSLLQLIIVNSPFSLLQSRYYRSSGTKVEAYERGSLFLNVTRRQADRSIISALKYLINHFFEMYGVEVCGGASI